MEVGKSSKLFLIQLAGGGFVIAGMAEEDAKGRFEVMGTYYFANYTN